MAKIMEDVLACSQGAAYLGQILSKAQVMGLKTDKKSHCHCSHTVVDILTNVSLHFHNYDSLGFDEIDSVSLVVP